MVGNFAYRNFAPTTTAKNMTKSEFDDLQLQAQASGKPLIAFLKEIGVSYSTYSYWRRKQEAEKAEQPMAPIVIRESAVSTAPVNLVQSNISI